MRLVFIYIFVISPKIWVLLFWSLKYVSPKYTPQPNTASLELYSVNTNSWSLHTPLELTILLPCGSLLWCRFDWLTIILHFWPIFHLDFVQNFNILAPISQYPNMRFKLFFIIRGLLQTEKQDLKCFSSKSTLLQSLTLVQWRGVYYSSYHLHYYFGCNVGALQAQFCLFCSSNFVSKLFCFFFGNVFPQKCFTEIFLVIRSEICNK